MFGVSVICFILAGASFAFGWTGGGVFFGAVNILTFIIALITRKGGAGSTDEYAVHPGDWQ